MNRVPPGRDLVIAALVGVVEIVGAALAGAHQDSGLDFSVGGAALLAVGALGLAWRVRHPVVALMVAYATTLTYVVLGYPQGPIYFALIVGFCTTLLHGHRVVAWVTIASGWCTFLWLPPLLGTGDAPSPEAALGLAAWLLVLATTTEIVRIRHERGVERRRAREEEARLQAREEQLRIARELHDVVAHNLSMINVQAGTALHLLPERPEVAAGALGAIKDASKDALDELRSLVDVLRSGPEAAPRRPTPTLADLGDLVERTQAAGLPTELLVRAAPRPLSRPVETAAYRVAQEALTNMARHAGPSRAVVALEYGDDALVVQVDDDGLGTSGPGTPTGKGIVGIRERVHALGGELEVGTSIPRGFRVRARIPIEAVAMIAVVIADDQALVHAGFHALLDAQDDIEVVGEAADGAEAMELTSRLRPDVVLMDIRMPGTDGLAATRAVGRDPELAAVRVVILTTFELDEYVFEALREGASGFLVKDTEPADLLRAVRAVAAGEALLSPSVTRRLIQAFATQPASASPAVDLGVLTNREREVMALVAGGLSNDKIATQLFVSTATAKTHVNRAMTKLHARDRAQLVVYAYESGLVRPGP